jgi:serine/threonine protein kinase
LKPENLVFDKLGNVSITDFGISITIEEEQQEEIMGTPIYISPEVILRKEYSEASDWWSLGILM